ncbi:MAG: tetratricopeptide repeat protein [Alphaproteobacteria bacterium]
MRYFSYSFKTCITAVAFSLLLVSCANDGYDDDYYGKNSPTFMRGIQAYASKDYISAYDYFYEEADDGNVGAMVNLGRMTHKGEGVPRNFQQAIGWFLDAAKEGDREARNNLKIMYNNGHGTRPDFEPVLAFYEDYAASGTPDDKYELGAMYFQGNGVEQSYTKAAHWYQEAANTGNYSAAHGLGVLHEYGLGMPANPIEAYIWYNNAASGDPSSAPFREKIARRLSPQQRADAQAASANWQPEIPEDEYDEEYEESGSYENKNNAYYYQ